MSKRRAEKVDQSTTQMLAANKVYLKTKRFRLLYIFPR